jgi:small neutral amino acid transporter SnatA (MarC family)
MSILTPSTLMFWVIVSSIISVKLNNKMNEKMVSFFIAMATQLSIDSAKSFYSSKLSYKIKESGLTRLNKIAGLIIIAFGIWMIGKTYINFYS